MKAWLTRKIPPGDPIELPDGRASIVLGSSPRATVVFDGAGVAGRHCELKNDGAFWHLSDLTSTTGTRVNGTAISRPRALFHGDVIELGTATICFQTDAPVDAPLLAAIAKDPDQPAPWLVYGDWLQEHGDPLGERIARAARKERLDHLPWLGPLFDAFVAGELEVDWQFGFAQRLRVRPVAGHLPFDWRETVSTFLGLRIGHFLRALSIDTPRLDQVGPRNGKAIGVAEAQHTLAQLPSLPAGLERLDLGYSFAIPLPPPELASEELALRAPKLRGTTVFTYGQGAWLKVLGLEPGVRLSGIESGVRELDRGGVLRVRRGQRNQLFLESPPGMPFQADGNPCYFFFSDGRCQLMAGRMRGEVRVNSRVDSAYLLQPGDVIELQATARLRYEVS